jgi:hypothetical protein
MEGASPMTLRPEDIRRCVLEAVERGDLPRGGPSHLAALDELDTVGAEYWARWSAAATDRIRQKASRR